MQGSTIAEILAAILGGGGLAPFLWKLLQRTRSQPGEQQKTKAEIEAISSHAAKETVDMMKGVLAVLNQQLKEGRAENLRLREEQVADRGKIQRLEEKVNELVSQVVSLGGTVDELTNPGAA